MGFRKNYDNEFEAIKNDQNIEMKRGTMGCVIASYTGNAIIGDSYPYICDGNNYRILLTNKRA